MRVLLDTHAFIWWHSDPARLSSTALTTCRDATNTLLLSLTSIWEMQIKIQLGKLQVSPSLEDVIQNQQQANQLELLPIELEHIYGLDQLAHHHRDPFDRLLIAQAIHGNLSIIIHDAEFAKYPVTIIW